MKTAVQVRHPTGDARPRAELVWGRPVAVEAGVLGPVALFGAGEIVMYLLRFRRRPRLFVFPTLTVDDRLAATLPGVRPRVQLLLELCTAGRIRRARGLFAYFVRTKRDPSGMPDDFYVRVGLALAGRLPSHKILLSLLPSTHALGDSRASPAGGAP
jgi:hypothetical protein